MHNIGTLKIVFHCFFLTFCINLAEGQSSKLLKKDGTYSIPLDIGSGFVADGIQFFELKGVKFLALGYRLSRKINIYSYSSRKLEKEIQFKMEGADGVGAEIPAFYIEDFDNIYVYSYWERTIFLLNEKGQVKDKFAIPEKLNHLIVEPNVMCPMIKVGDMLYMSGVATSTDLSEKSLLEVDFKSKKATTIGVVPYALKEWNFHRKNWLKFDYVNDKNFGSL
jgi:hypothetical protein